MPFQGDSLKKGFHLALSRHHDLLHVSLLRAGSELISALVGVADGRTFSLGMAMFSPFRASYSPVTVHLLMLVELLHQEGFQALRFDARRRRLSSSASRRDHDRVRTLTIYFPNLVMDPAPDDPEEPVRSLSAARALEAAAQRRRASLSKLRKGGTKGIARVSDGSNRRNRVAVVVKDGDSCVCVVRAQEAGFACR